MSDRRRASRVLFTAALALTACGQSELFERDVDLDVDGGTRISDARDAMPVAPNSDVGSDGDSADARDVEVPPRPRPERLCTTEPTLLPLPGGPSEEPEPAACDPRSMLHGELYRCAGDGRIEGVDDGGVESVRHCLSCMPQRGSPSIPAASVTEGVCVGQFFEDETAAPVVFERWRWDGEMQIHMTDRNRDGILDRRVVASYDEEARVVALQVSETDDGTLLDLVSDETWRYLDGGRTEHMRIEADGSFDTREADTAGRMYRWRRGSEDSIEFDLRVTYSDRGVPVLAQDHALDPPENVLLFEPDGTVSYCRTASQRSRFGCQAATGIWNGEALSLSLLFPTVWSPDAIDAAGTVVTGSSLLSPDGEVDLRTTRELQIAFSPGGIAGIVEEQSVESDPTWSARDFRVTARRTRRETNGRGEPMVNDWRTKPSFTEDENYGTERWHYEGATLVRYGWSDHRNRYYDGWPGDSGGGWSVTREGNVEAKWADGYSAELPIVDETFSFRIVDDLGRPLLSRLGPSVSTSLPSYFGYWGGRWQRDTRYWYNDDGTYDSLSGRFPQAEDGLSVVLSGRPESQLYGPPFQASFRGWDRCTDEFETAEIYVGACDRILPDDPPTSSLCPELDVGLFPLLNCE